MVQAVLNVSQAADASKLDTKSNEKVTQAETIKRPGKWAKYFRDTWCK